MKNKKTIFLIVGLIFLAIILIYSLKSPQIASNGVSVVGDQGVAGGVSNGNLADEGDEIVKILSMLSSVSLETNFFEDQLFLSLEDFSVASAEGSIGRNNPFADY